jgi:DNA-binding NtrC family response regulator
MLANQDLQSLKNRFGIIGNDAALNYALGVALQVANTDLTVLIQGESGVGKEVFSKIIHQYSSRKHESFIAINCGAIPEGTIDSELFGHEKGSFTSAVGDRKGYFETVNSGTIFLDEIGEMPLGTQARLLRVLESGEYIKVGSSKVLKTNVRVVAATNKDLKELAAVGKFREDLFYRLSTVPIRVPALRERKNDISLLFRKFAADFADKYRTDTIHLDEAAQQLLTAYSWPGNIRELKNMAEQISVLSQSKKLSAAELQFYIPEDNQQKLPAIIPSESGEGSTNFSSERDLLYKLFFDMKKDVTDVKKMFFEIMKSPSGAQAYQGEPNFQNENRDSQTSYLPSNGSMNEREATSSDGGQPIIISQGDQSTSSVQEVEDVLDLAENEKTLIIKALKKHRGRRRNAAAELGISERTLYRKIKEYDVDI